MALMLRKAAVEALQAADLDPYHADLDAKTKEFKLYTPCGKTFATVSGVLFSSLAPTKDEIAYAIELLEFWLLRNKLAIDTYLAAFATLQMYGDLSFKKDGMTVKADSFYSQKLGKRIQSMTIVVKHDGIYYRFNADGLLISVSWDDPIPVTTQIKLPAAKVIAATTFLDEHLNRQAAQKTVDEILAEMNTCKDM